MPLFDAAPLEVASQLDGMFGVVAVSADGKTAVAMRDPVGIKPLYRGWCDSGRVVIASELRCLVDAGVDQFEEFPNGHRRCP